MITSQFHLLPIRDWNKAAAEYSFNKSHRNFTYSLLGIET